MSANEIYGIVSGSHLGDVWLIVSGALRLSLARGVPVFLSRFAYDSESFEVRYAEDFANLICQCIDALDLPNAQVIVTGMPQNQHHHLDHSFTIPHSAYFCNQPPLPTKCQWKGPPETPLVSIQMESLRFSGGQYRDELPHWLSDFRNCPFNDVLSIYRRLLCLQAGRATIVGKHQGPVAASIHTLCNSTIFVGIDSGMSHVASSVGVPTYVWQWQHTEDASLNVYAWHRNKNIKTFRGLTELEEILRLHGIN